MKFDRFSDCKCQQHWHRQHRHSDPIDKQVAMRHLCQPKYLHSPTSSIYIAIGRGPLGFLWTNMLLNFQYKAITWEFATSSWYRHFARESYDPRAPDSSAAIVINIRNISDVRQWSCQWGLMLYFHSYNLCVTVHPISKNTSHFRSLL